MLQNDSSNSGGEGSEQETRFQHLRKAYGLTFILALFGVIFILLGVINKPTYENAEQLSFMQKYGPAFLKELGFATIIACLAILTIEMRAKKEHLDIEEKARKEHNARFANQIDEINRNLFRSVYKRHFDNNYVDLIDEILQRKFYFKNYSMDITMRDEGMHNGTIPLITLEFHYRFVVQNISNEREKYSFKLEIERPTLAGPENIARMTGFTINQEKLNPSDIEQADEAELDTPDFKRYAKEHEINGGDELSIDVSAIVYKAFDDEFTWRAFQPSEGMRVNINVDQNIVGVSGMGVVSYKPYPVLQRTVSGSYSLTIDRPLLPGNGFAIWWTRFPTGATENSEGQSSESV